MSYRLQHFNTPSLLWLPNCTGKEYYLLERSPLNVEIGEQGLPSKNPCCSNGLNLPPPTTDKKPSPSVTLAVNLENLLPEAKSN